MKLLFTGASGFFGRNIYQLLEKMYVIKTVGLTPQDDYKIDIARNIPVFTEVFDIVLHAAGKAHSIPKTEEEKQSFFDVTCKVLRIYVPLWDKEVFLKFSFLLVPLLFMVVIRVRISRKSIL